jgi:hypothetical protein
VAIVIAPGFIIVSIGKSSYVTPMWSVLLHSRRGTVCNVLFMEDFVSLWLTVSNWKSRKSPLGWTNECMISVGVLEVYSQCKVWLMKSVSRGLTNWGFTQGKPPCRSYGWLKCMILGFEKGLWSFLGSLFMSFFIQDCDSGSAYAVPNLYFECNSVSLKGFIMNVEGVFVMCCREREQELYGFDFCQSLYSVF